MQTRRWGILLLSIAAGSQLGASCGKPDIPATKTNYALMYASQTSSSEETKIAQEKTARLRVNDIMTYLGIIPVYDDTHAIVLDPPTYFGDDCQYFLHPDDSDNQQDCGTPNMARDYVAHTRSHPPFLPLPAERLVMVVSPFRQLAGKDNLGFALLVYPRNFALEGAYVFDDRVTAVTGAGDDRWRGLGAVSAHEIGHLLPPAPIGELTDVRDRPDLHNPDYDYGCIMKDLSIYDIRRSYKDDPLIFCRTTGSHPQNETCHGLLRAYFNLPYEVEH